MAIAVAESVVVIAVVVAEEEPELFEAVAAAAGPWQVVVPNWAEVQSELVQ